MSEKIFVNAHPDDEATMLTAFKRSVETDESTHLICVSNGDSNVKQNSGIRERETTEAVSAYLGMPPSNVNNMLHFCHSSETEFREALLNARIEWLANDVRIVLEKIISLISGSTNVQLYTNFPDGGDPRHLWVAWIMTNIVYPRLKSQGINVEIFGNPKQIFDKKGVILTVGRLPDGLEERLPFAQRANVPEIELINGIIKLVLRERGWIENVFKRPEIYASQKATPQNLELFMKYIEWKLHHEEHLWKITSPLDYGKLREQLGGYFSFEPYAEKQVKAGIHKQAITHDHILSAMDKVESEL